MTTTKWLPNIALCLALAACGGGGSGGGVGSTPAPGGGSTPTPTPTPTPTNTIITDLQASQSFTTSSATAALTFNLTSGTTATGSAPRETLTVAYDAATRTYTVSTSGRSQSFAPTDQQTGNVGETKFRKSNGTATDLLTLVTTPYSGMTANKYVAAGYWQRNEIAGSTQTTSFDSFVYGFPTAATGVPRNGSAGFATDVFGLVSVPGQEPRVFQGGGALTADFTSGVFSTETFVTETRLLTGQSASGGSIKLTAAGRLGSDGSITGNALYSGATRLAGTLSGRFYGPGAEEVGATFTTSNADGSTATGSLTAQRDSRVPAANLTLTNILKAQRYFAQSSMMTIQREKAAGSPIRETRGHGGLLVSSFEDQTSGNITFGPPISNQPGGAYTTTSLVSSPNANFVRYQKSFNDVPTTVDLFKAGPANTELALTYVSFGRWRAVLPEFFDTTNVVHFTYGFETPAGILGAKTGSASYRGIAYGAGANTATNTEYDVRGTSTFNVDFSNQRYTGALNLNGTATTGGAATDFGRFDFAGRIESVAIDSVAGLMRGGTNVGELRSRFYGPDGEEIAAPFSLITNGTVISGVTAAKRD